MPYLGFVLAVQWEPIADQTLTAAWSWNVPALRARAVDLKQSAQILAAALATAIIQHFAVAAPQVEAREANRSANFEARDQLAVCLRALHESMEDEAE